MIASAKPNPPCDVEETCSRLDAKTGLGSPVGLPPEPYILESVGRIGAELFNIPVVVDASRGQSSFANATGFFDQAFLKYRHDCHLATINGEPLGKLSLIDFQSHPPLEEKKQAALRDLGILASGYLEAREAIGQIDHVTLLPNRVRFLRDNVHRVELGAKKEPSWLVLVTLADAPTFNGILRALGHGFADNVVRLGMMRLRDVLPLDTKLYHISVLTLAFLLPAGGMPEEAAARIVNSFGKPLVCEGVPISTKIGVGFTEFSPAIHSAAECLRAGLTAAQASRSAIAGWARYDQKTDEAHRRAFALLSSIGSAIESADQLSLHFQPRVCLVTGHCVGAEALLRWNHPTLGPISPAEFLPLVDATALINPLTEWVLDTGVRQVKEWQACDIDLKLALNVSPNNLRESNFAEMLAERLENLQVDPASIELEFTESALTGTEPQVMDAIAKIRSMGIEIAIDDFGTGYSNMNYLTQLPAQIVKIDQSFIRTMANAPRQQMLVQSITNLAHSLGFRVVAEGIETKDVYRMLREWGCEEGQGYLMSRPLPAEQFAAWVQQTRGMKRPANAGEQ